MSFTTGKSPVSLKHSVKQCLLLKMLACASQLQLWWNILTEFALISTHRHTCWCQSCVVTHKVSHSAYQLQKDWLTGAEQWRCFLCINDPQVWMCFCLLLQFFCKLKFVIFFEMCLIFVYLVPRICHLAIPQLNFIFIRFYIWRFYWYRLIINKHPPPPTPITSGEQRLSSVPTLPRCEFESGKWHKYSCLYVWKHHFKEA